MKQYNKTVQKCLNLIILKKRHKGTFNHLGICFYIESLQTILCKTIFVFND